MSMQRNLRSGLARLARHFSTRIPSAPGRQTRPSATRWYEFISVRRVTEEEWARNRIPLPSMEIRVPEGVTAFERLGILALSYGVFFGIVDLAIHRPLINYKLRKARELYESGRSRNFSQVASRGLDESAT